MGKDRAQGKRFAQRVYFCPPLSQERHVREIPAPNVKSKERASRTLLRENFSRFLLSKFLALNESTPSQGGSHPFLLDSSQEGLMTKRVLRELTIRFIVLERSLVNWRLEEQEEGCRLAALAGGEAAAALPVFREAKMKGGFCALGVRHV